MSNIDAAKLTNKALADYDAMMIEATIKVEKFAPLAVNIWSDVLKELDRRGKVKLISGSYDEVGSALL